MHQEMTSPLTVQACHEYIEQEVFRLQPRDYGLQHPNWPGMVGLELEVLVLQRGQTDPAGYPALAPLNVPEPSTAGFLRSLMHQQPGWTPEFFDSANPEAGLMRVSLEEGDLLSFEPGGQLEFSSVPYPCLGDALARLRQVQGVMDQAAPACGVALCQVGLNPWQTVAQIGLQMAKPRYRAMDQHFAEIGPYGQRMMRQTCTLQVNLDFGPDELTLVKRFVAAQLIAPFATAIFANSPFVDGKATGYRSFRSRIWQDTDPSRTGFVAMRLDAASMADKRGVCRAYSDAVLDAAVVFVAGAGYQRPTTKTTFREWVEHPLFGVKPTQEDLKTHLSLFFPEVRARGFLELRSIDAQARTWQAIPAAFYTGILYDDVAIEKVLELLVPEAVNLVDFWHKSSFGLQDPRLAALAKQVCERAMEGFSRLPSCFRENCAAANFLTFYRHFTARGRSPACDLLDFVSKSQVSVPNLAILEELNGYWQSLIS